MFDCGPLNRNGAIYIGLALALVNMGFFDAVITIFLQRHHSKEICDRFSGHIDRKFGENFAVANLKK